MLGYGVYEHFVSYKTGIHFGGKVTDNQILNFDNIPFAEQSKSEKAGIGMLPNITDNNDTQKKDRQDIDKQKTVHCLPWFRNFAIFDCWWVL